ncbi:hypothetical protein DFP72DRAFT_853946 [Ephemerocybe angulata]|uniref:Uncharacterized protein n=1 Tax=Ephemerocybe angulata TaxID=980116 RepID=A0A8H6HJL6_9AGAR|nr:hypothetical protein DFP72DRAFT_853946 [Tulosesus angulatus]
MSIHRLTSISCCKGVFKHMVLIDDSGMQQKPWDFLFIPTLAWYLHAIKEYWNRVEAHRFAEGEDEDVLETWMRFGNSSQKGLAPQGILKEYEPNDKDLQEDEIKDIIIQELMEVTQKGTDFVKNNLKHQGRGVNNVAVKFQVAPLSPEFVMDIGEVYLELLEAKGSMLSIGHSICTSYCNIIKTLTKSKTSAWRMWQLDQKVIYQELSDKKQAINEEGSLEKSGPLRVWKRGDH